MTSLAPTPTVDHHDPDEDLVRQLLHGDAAAVETLVARYGAKVYQLALKITGNPQDAQEVSQDALWSIVSKIGAFKGEAALESWIYRITANAAYQRLRRRRPQEQSWEDVVVRLDGEGKLAEPHEDWSPYVQDPALVAEARRVIQEAVDALPDDYRVAFLLHDVQGLPNPEIARALDLSLPAVKSRIHRARLFLRRELGAYFDRVKASEAEAILARAETRP
jgi:RNA polymerase sigma-70 factor (ECF subfamily)